MFHVLAQVLPPHALKEAHSYITHLEYTEMLKGHDLVPQNNKRICSVKFPKVFIKFFCWEVKCQVLFKAGGLKPRVRVFLI